MGEFSTYEAVLLAHAAGTLGMTGLVWFVQAVHYPLFAAVGQTAFQAYEAAHVRRTGWVVGPLMALELGTGILLPLLAQPGAERVAAATGLALLGLIWGSTALLQIPQHRRLEHRFDPAAHRALVSSNWIRTWAWSARSLLVLALLGAATT